MPADPTKANSVFDGWSLTSGGVENFNDTYLVQANMTVYARWRVTVTFDGNGGTPSDVGTVTVDIDDTILESGQTLPSPAPTKSGAVFDGWSTTATGARAIFNENTPVSANLTVYARWNVTVTFDKNTGDTEANPTTKNADYNTTIDALPTAPAKTGYTFVNWNTAANGSGTEFTALTLVTDNITVYAQWTINIYTLDYAAADSNGTISGATHQTVDHGSSGTLVSANPITGYHFTSWSDGVLTAARTDINVAGNINVTANFAIDTHTLTYNAGANGGITGTTPQTINYGSDGTAVEAAPAFGYHFTSWSDGVLTAARTDTNVIADKSVTANFSNALVLSYIAGANGTIAGVNPQDLTYGSDGTEVTATPSVGYHFTAWNDAVTTANRTDTNITANTSFTASFAINTYTLNYVAGSNGTLTGTLSQTVNHGANGTTITANPASSYHFVNWSDGSRQNPRQDNSVTGNLNVTANFSNALVLTYTAGTGGDISGTNPQSVTYNSTGSAVTAVPRTGYHFVSWSDNGSTQAARLDVNVITDIFATANFAIDTFTLKYKSDDNGKIDGDASQTVSYDGNGSRVDANPDTGYLFKEWSDGSDESSRKDENIKANLSVTAEFEKEEYVLIYNAGANGSLSGDVTQKVEYKENGTAVTAVPGENYHFTSWSDSSIQNPRTDMDVKADFAVTANFASNDLSANQTKSYTLVYTAGANGTLSGQANQVVKEGESGQSVSVVADNNYHFDGWSDGGTQNPRTDTNIDRDIYVVATFKINNDAPVVAPVTEPTNKPVVEEKKSITGTKKQPENKKVPTNTDSTKEESIIATILPTVPTENQTEAQIVTAVALSTTILPLLYQVGSAKSLAILLSNLPIGFLGLLSKTKRRKNWGMAYNSVSGDPISFVSISVIDAITGKTKESKLTDKYGGYFFLVPKGEYQLKIKKEGYEIDNHNIDAKTYYTNVLADPEKRTLVFTEPGIICYDICLKSTSPIHKAFRYKDLIFAVIFYLGFALTVINAFSNPNGLNWFLTIAYIISAIIRNITLSGSKWGYVVNKDGVKQPFSAISLLDRSTRRLIARTISDENGRYILLANPGSYILRAIANTSKEEQISLIERGMIKKTVVL
jgi:uncharacterized repeat protein (TIGR02543 family)